MTVSEIIRFEKFVKKKNNSKLTDRTEKERARGEFSKGNQSIKAIVDLKYVNSKWPASGIPEPIYPWFQYIPDKSKQSLNIPKARPNIELHLVTNILIVEPTL